MHDSWLHSLALVAAVGSIAVTPGCGDGETCSFEEPAAVVAVTSTDGEPLNVRSLVQVNGAPAETVVCSDGFCRWYGDEGAALTFTITVGECTEVVELEGQGGDSCESAAAAMASVTFDLDACVTD